MKRKILNIFFLLNIIEFIYSSYNFTIIAKNFSSGNIPGLNELKKDLGQCTCNLTALCDYNCPCDNDCTSEDKEKFNTKEIDVTRYNKNRMEEFKCKSRKETFEYNKNKAGINVKDHIFNLMCIQFDRSGDLGEFYEENPKEGEREKAKSWIKRFFETIKDKDLNSQNIIYKPDSNGYCLKSNISELKSHEYSCIDNNFDKSDITGNTYGEGNRISGVNMKYSKSSSQNEILRTNSNSRIIDFKVSWESEDTSNLRSSNGYIQNRPIKIKLGEDIYEQYYFPIINKEGKCIDNTNIEDTISFKSILFKNNAIYSCITDNVKNTIIYQTFFEQNMKICLSPKDCDNSIEIVSNSHNVRDQEDQDYNIQLIIYTTKKGKEYSPYEEIQYSEIFINENAINGLLIFKIKFIDISSSSYINTKNGKITSLNKIPDNIMNTLS